MKEQYKILRNAVTPEVCDLIKNSLNISKDIKYFVTGMPKDNHVVFGDPQCSNSFAMYGNLSCEALLVSLQSLVEEVSQKKLIPTYSYSRIYWQGATLEEHRDGPRCEYSVTLCIENKNDPWAIYMGTEEVLLNAGDLVIYKGMELLHHRNVLEDDTEVTQVFLHYVDADNEYAEWALDKRPVLGL